MKLLIIDYISPPAKLTLPPNAFYPPRKLLLLSRSGPHVLQLHLLVGGVVLLGVVLRVGGCFRATGSCTSGLWIEGPSDGQRGGVVAGSRGLDLDGGNLAVAAGHYLLLLLLLTHGAGCRSSEASLTRSRLGEESVCVCT